MKTPERIWLVNLGDEVVWHDDPKPTGYEEVQDSVEYVRADGQQPSAEPVAWLYLFKDPLGGGPVWRNSPSEWNGQKPHGSKPLYAHPPSDELEALRRDATRYRWLKGLNDGVILLQDDDGILIEDAADTAIDEDMAKQKGGQL